MSFTTQIAALRKRYGRPAPPPVTDLFEIILYENIAYLVADERRAEVWQRFYKKIGPDPGAILATPASQLAALIKDGGMQPERRAQKLRDAAEIVLEECDGDLDAAIDALLRDSPSRARRLLKKFPGLGDPGADKLLLFSRRRPILALDSNGLRVLVRLGYAEESPNYARTYAAAQHAIASTAKLDIDWLIDANQLLRQHGQTLCKRTAPACKSCPLAAQCAYARAKPQKTAALENRK